MPPSTSSERPPTCCCTPTTPRHSGVVDGQRVVVRTERGHLTGTAKVDPAIRRGALSVPHGHHGVNVNALTDKDVVDPVTGMVRYSCVPVSVEPAPASDAVDEVR